MQLRQYQEKAVKNLRDILRGGKRCPICVSPTGSGKSIIIGKIISLASENGKMVLWLVHRRNLVYQMRDVLEKFFNIDAGIIMAGIDTDLEKKVQLCTYQTFRNRIKLGYFSEKKIFIDPDIVIIDECHRSISPSYKEILNTYEGKIIIGTTATPMRADGRGLSEIYDSIVDVAGVKELTDAGYLAPARYFAPVNVDLEGVKTAMGDYQVKDLAGKVHTTKLIGDIVENWLKLAENRQTIVYAVNVRHSKAICEEFVKQGVNAEHLDARSNDEERDDVFRRMENGDITVICNVALYQEGLDVPDVSCIVMARPTKSMGLYRQCCGRGLRPAAGKRDCLILDHGNVIETHGLLDWEIEWSLDGKKKAWNKPKREKTEKLVKCRACHKVFMGSNTCPDCGTKVKSFGKKIMTVEAELEEIGEKTEYSMVEKRQWYGMFKGHAEAKGYKEGWISHKYKEKFGVWPNSLKDTSSIEPTDEFRRWLKYLTIKWVKSKKKEEKIAKEQLNRGGELAESYRLQSSQV